MKTEEPTAAKEVKSSQKYTFDLIHNTDGSSEMRRSNKGFSVIEIIGITALVQNDMMKLLRENVKPIDKITRTSTDSPIIHKPTE